MIYNTKVTFKGQVTQEIPYKQLGRREYGIEMPDGIAFIFLCLGMDGRFFNESGGQTVEPKTPSLVENRRVMLPPRKVMI